MALTLCAHQMLVFPVYMLFRLQTHLLCVCMCRGIPAGQLAVKEDILPFCRQKQETVIREVATGRGIVCFLFVLFFWRKKKGGGGEK